tara:strand:- start:133 stop:1137 length:1005 start_codon:yes stop_codon:yes gene_type:complete
MDKIIIIDDSRIKFGNITFSNYKKSEVIKKLINCMYYQKIEESFYWTCELLCSNFIIELWEVYFLFMSKYIHKENPKLPIYLYKKYEDFRNTAKLSKNDFELRNNNTVRIILCTITTVLTYSKKGNIIENVKQDYYFDSEKLYENFQAPGMSYAESIFAYSDPKELFIPLNELSYHLNETKNRVYIYYWINWIIKYDSLCKKKKNEILCYKREFVTVDHKKLSLNVIWMVWDLLFSVSEKNKTKHTIIKSLLNLFSIKYKQSTNSKRISILFFCVEIILSDINSSIPLIDNEEPLKTIGDNVNIIFESLKKNEQQCEVKPMTKKDIYELTYNKL